MHRHNLNRVEFYSKNDITNYENLLKAESILKQKVKTNYSDINDILELYNIKKYIDNELFFRSWTEEDIKSFKQKTIEYSKIIGHFISNISDQNVTDFYKNTSFGYINSFWELINNQKAFKRISSNTINLFLQNEPHVIQVILTKKYLVEYYDKEIRNFLLNYSKSAEILLNIYEVKNDLSKTQYTLPKSLSNEDKEYIISSYLDLDDFNYNYLGLIQNAKNKSDFKISDKTRLKAMRLHKSETDKFFSESNGLKYGVSVSFPSNLKNIKESFVDEELITHYSYSYDFIKENKKPYILFQNFKYLFEYLDEQNRIDIVSKKSQLDELERIMGIHSENEYIGGTAFSHSEMRSQIQIIGYKSIAQTLGTSLEDILENTFTITFKEKYNFAENARFVVPPSKNSYLEKVRLLAPEFESIQKQYKLFVEDGSIDFELLQITSSPTSIKDIPSLNPNKYIYFNKENKVMVNCSNILFSDQTFLTYIDPYKEKQYRTFFDLIINEEVSIESYKDYDKPSLEYLKDNGLITWEDNEIIKMKSFERILILKDLFENEFASYYHYPLVFLKESLKMHSENIIFFESSLYSRPEQAYFNYFLNKSEFTNGLDLRNKYVHGTQANPEEIQKHEFAYFTYLKLVVLTMLKIDDDLNICKSMKKIV